MDIDMNCKACGEPGAKVVETTEYYTAPFGRPIAYQQRHTECGSCGVELDVSDPDAFPNAIHEAELSSVEEMLTFFKEVRIPLGRIERSLELPHRQLSNWKSKEAWSKSGLALLRILRAYPWIIDVADKHFRPEVVQGKLIEAAHIELCYKLPADTSSSGTGRPAWVESDVRGFSKMAATTALAATAVVSMMGFSKEKVQLPTQSPLEMAQEFKGLSA